MSCSSAALEGTDSNQHFAAGSIYCNARSEAAAAAAVAGSTHGTHVAVSASLLYYSYRVVAY